MQPPPEKKRKLFNENEQRETGSSADKNSKQENDWGDDDDDFENLLTQQENLNLIDNLVASSQLPQRGVTNSNALCRITYPSFSIENKTEDSKTIETLKQQLKDLQQQLYTKDGEVKFLKNSNNKLNKELLDEKQQSFGVLNEKTQQFEREKNSMQNELKSLTARLEFKEHELNKTNFASRSDASPGRLSVKARSFDASSSPQIALPRTAPPRAAPSQTPVAGSRGFLGTASFLAKKKGATREEGCQVDLGGRRVRESCKQVVKLNRRATNSNTTYAVGVLDELQLMRHFANQLNFRTTGCPGRHQVCLIDVEAKSRNLTQERMLSMSAKMTCSVVEVIVRKKYGRARSFSSSDIPSFLDFLQDSKRRLEDWLSSARTRKRELSASSLLAPTKRKHLGGTPTKKFLDPILNVLVMLDALLRSAGPCIFEVAATSDIMSLMLEIIGEDRLTDSHEIVVTCLQVVSMCLRNSVKLDASKYSRLFDEGGLVARVLKSIHDPEERSDAHDLSILFVLELITRLYSSSAVPSDVCKEIDTDCLLKMVCSSVNFYRSSDNPRYLSVQNQFHVLVRAAFSRDSNVKRELNQDSCCDCLSKVFLEILYGAESLCDSHEGSDLSSGLGVAMRGLSLAQFVVKAFPAIFKSCSSYLMAVLSQCEEVLKKFRGTANENELHEFWNISKWPNADSVTEPPEKS